MAESRSSISGEGSGELSRRIDFDWGEDPSGEWDDEAGTSPGWLTGRAQVSGDPLLRPYCDDERTTTVQDPKREPRNRLFTHPEQDGNCKEVSTRTIERGDTNSRSDDIEQERGQEARRMAQREGRRKCEGEGTRVGNLDTGESPAIHAPTMTALELMQELIDRLTNYIGKMRGPPGDLIRCRGGVGSREQRAATTPIQTPVQAPLTCLPGSRRQHQIVDAYYTALDFYTRGHVDKPGGPKPGDPVEKARRDPREPIPMEPDPCFSIHAMETHWLMKQLSQHLEAYAKPCQRCGTSPGKDETSQTDAPVVGTRPLLRRTPIAPQLGKFDGRTPSLNTFLARYELFSRFYQWDEKERLFQLQVSLEKHASDALWDGSGADTSLGLIRVLIKRFSDDRYIEERQGKWSQTAVAEDSPAWNPGISEADSWLNGPRKGSTGPGSTPHPRKTGVCFGCGEEGHFRRECPRRGAVMSVKMNRRVRAENGDVKEKGTAANVRKIAWELGEPKTYIEIEICGLKHFCVLDTGSDYSLMPRKLVPQAKVVPMSIKLSAANGGKLNVLGAMRAGFSIQGTPFTADLLVSDDVDEFMLGYDWLAFQNARWHFDERTLILQGLRVPLHDRRTSILSMRPQETVGPTLRAGMVQAESTARKRRRGTGSEVVRGRNKEATVSPRGDLLVRPEVKQLRPVAALAPPAPRTQTRLWRGKTTPKLKAPVSGPNSVPTQGEPISVLQ